MNYHTLHACYSYCTYSREQLFTNCLIQTSRFGYAKCMSSSPPPQTWLKLPCGGTQSGLDSTHSADRARPPLRSIPCSCRRCMEPVSGCDNREVRLNTYSTRITMEPCTLSIVLQQIPSPRSPGTSKLEAGTSVL